MDNIVPKIDKDGLRQFGMVTATIIALLFGLLLPYLFDRPIPELPLPFKISIILAGIALLLPIILRPIYVVWMYIGFVLGWINTRLILGVVFYTLFTPIALLMKILRKDPMNRRFGANIKSYRKTRTESPKHQMEKPY